MLYVIDLQAADLPGLARLADLARDATAAADPGEEWATVWQHVPAEWGEYGDTVWHYPHGLPPGWRQASPYLLGQRWQPADLAVYVSVLAPDRAAAQRLKDDILRRGRNLTDSWRQDPRGSEFDSCHLYPLASRPVRVRLIFPRPLSYLTPVLNRDLRAQYDNVRDGEQAAIFLRLAYAGGADVWGEAHKVGAVLPSDRDARRVAYDITEVLGLAPEVTIEPYTAP